MKKILLVLALMLPIITLAQTKKTTVKKTVTSKSTPLQKTVNYKHISFTYDGKLNFLSGKPFEVIEAPGYTQKELYQKLLLALTSLYKNVDKVATKIEYDAIVVNGFDDMLAAIDLAGSVEKVEGYYNIKFSFKDGKIRIDLPTVDLSVRIGNKSRSISTSIDGLKMLDTGVSVIVNRILKQAYETTESDW